MLFIQRVCTSVTNLLKHWLYVSLNFRWSSSILYIILSHIGQERGHIFFFWSQRNGSAMHCACLPRWRWSLPVQTCGNNIHCISNIVCSSAESEHLCWKFRSDPQQRNFNELKIYFLMHVTSRLSFYCETASHWSQTQILQPEFSLTNEWFAC